MDKDELARLEKNVCKSPEFKAWQRNLRAETDKRVLKNIGTRIVYRVAFVCLLGLVGLVISLF